MSDWIELFNGEDLQGWTARGPHDWKTAARVWVDDVNPERLQNVPGTGVMVNGDWGDTVDLHTEREHGSCELHLEFCVARHSNSGVYLQGQYEIQILDSWGKEELKFSTNGAIYARWVEETKTAYDGYPPRVNASLAPGEWQTLEVRFHAPRFDAAGNKSANARFERVVLNGQVIHEDVECSGPTRGAWNETDIPRGPLRLQGDHGPVAFRNLRLRPLE
jgi:hypothetical protein